MTKFTPIRFLRLSRRDADWLGKLWFYYMLLFPLVNKKKRIACPRKVLHIPPKIAIVEIGETLTYNIHIVSLWRLPGHAQASRTA